MDKISDVGKYPFLIFSNNERMSGTKNFFETYKDVTAKQDFDPDYHEVLKSVFFSKENMNIIQSMLQKMVYERSNYRISRQNDDHLMNIAMDVFKTYCKNLPFQIKEQIMELNEIVVKFVYPYIIKQIEAIYRYREDIESPIQTMPLPQNTSIQGQRTLPAFR
jgi:hypothetical protein